MLNIVFKKAEPVFMLRGRPDKHAIFSGTVYSSGRQYISILMANTGRKVRFDVDTRLSHTENSVSTMRVFPTLESLDEAMEKARIIDAINHWYNTLSVTFFSESLSG